MVAEDRLLIKFDQGPSVLIDLEGTVLAEIDGYIDPGVLALYSGDCLIAGTIGSKYYLHHIGSGELVATLPNKPASLRSGNGCTTWRKGKPATVVINDQLVDLGDTTDIEDISPDGATAVIFVGRERFLPRYRQRCPNPASRGHLPILRDALRDARTG